MSSSSPAPIAVAPIKSFYTPALHQDEINERAIIIDTETTGRGATAEIIEVAVCDFRGTILYESLVRPTASVPRAAARIHKLTTADLTDAPTWDRVWRELAEIIEARTLIAYNASFDRRMIETMAARYRLSSPALRWRCAMQFIKERAGVRRSLPLEEACRLFGVEAGTHRAASDARATAALLRRFAQ